MGRVAFEYTQRLRARSHNVHVFTTQSRESVEDPTYVHRIPPIVQIGNAGVLPSLFYRLKGFDIIHLHYPFFGGAEPTIVRKALRPDQGLVMTYHMDAVAGGIRGAVFGLHRRVLFPWLLSRVDRLLVSSKDYMESSQVVDTDRVLDRVEVHPFGIDLERFYPGTESELQRELGIATTVPVLLFVGGMDQAHHFKGVEVLLEAVALLEDTSLALVLVGDGDLKESYLRRAEELGINKKVHFVGNVSDEILPHYYRMADVHVFPSTRRAEAFGLVALEAAASGVPTIASDLPGVRTVVRDGTTGLLVEPGSVEKLAQAVSLLINTPELRERFALGAHAHAQTTFAWDPLIDRLEQTYQSVLGQKSDRIYPTASL